jgi:tRNA (adenine37-N6)-methyltransferase
MADEFRIHPVGIVLKTKGSNRIEIDEAYEEALAGLSEFSHIQVFYWFHKNDMPEKRRTLQVHPKKNHTNPLTGVFATLSPLRPNLIGLSICGIRLIEGNTIVIDDIDALDGSPVIDIKCFVPSRISPSKVKMPDWAKT